MRDLRALVVADSALPIGLHAQSFGLERALQLDPQQNLAEVIVRVLRSPDILVDATAVALAHRRRHEDLVALDTEVTAARSDADRGRASRHSGRRLARLATDICDTGYCAQVRDRRTDGNLGVVHGAITSALRVPEEDAVLMAVHRVATALMLAAVRLGHIGVADGQLILTELAPAILESAEQARVGDLRPRDDSRLRERTIGPSHHDVPRAPLFQT